MTELLRPVDVRLLGADNLTGLFTRRILRVNTASSWLTTIQELFNAQPASLCVVEETDQDISASLPDYILSLICWAKNEAPPEREVHTGRQHADCVGHSHW